MKPVPPPVKPQQAAAKIFSPWMKRISFIGTTITALYACLVLLFPVYNFSPLSVMNGSFCYVLINGDNASVCHLQGRLTVVDPAEIGASVELIREDNETFFVSTVGNNPQPQMRDKVDITFFAISYPPSVGAIADERVFNPFTILTVIFAAR